MEELSMHSLFTRTIAFLVLSLLGIIPLGFGQQPTATDVYGGQGGSPFSDLEIPYGARVYEVYVFSGNYVDAVQISYMLPDGRSVKGARHGGSGGRQNVFRLDSDEYIIGLSGRCGAYVDSIRIQTNKRTSSLFGGRGGIRDYRVDISYGNQAVGFAGRAGNYLDAIGLTYSPLTMLVTNQSTIFGGEGGAAFSDREIPVGARVTEVRVRSGDFIDSIQLVYTLENGEPFEGPIHGGQGGRPSVFSLDRDEYVIGLSGRYGRYIDSLSIITNSRTSAIFGGRGGNRNFRIMVPEGNQVIGLSGRSAEFLDAVGINSAPIRSQLRDSRRRQRR
jgi:hypothetical protein